jgi:hypothetical protein
MGQAWPAVSRCQIQARFQIVKSHLNFSMSYGGNGRACCCRSAASIASSGPQGIDD